MKLEKYYKYIYSFVLFFIYLIPAIIMKIFNVKVPNFRIDHIGHLLVEPDIYIKCHILEKNKIPNTIMLASIEQVPNVSCLKYWEEYFFVIKSPIFIKLMKPLSFHLLTRYEIYKIATSINNTASTFSVQNAWNNRKSTLVIDSYDKERGGNYLNNVGIDTWYVCVHCREPGYHPRGEHAHNFRNAKIETYFPAIKYIVSQGGVCIRMGDSTMTPLPQIEGLIDYARSAQKADWLDLYLAASCKFFLGSCSGAYAMASVFGVPVATANNAPLPTCLPWGKKDIGIPKLYRETSSGRLMTFREILSSPAAHYRYAIQFKEAGIELVDNSPEDILDLAREQLGRVNGSYEASPADKERQTRFKSMIKPGHYTYGSASRVCDAFLRKYEHLLD